MHGPLNVKFECQTRETAWLPVQKTLLFHKLHFVGKPRTKIKTFVDRFLATFNEPLEHELGGHLTLLDSRLFGCTCTESKTVCKTPLFKMSL